MQSGKVWYLILVFSQCGSVGDGYKNIESYLYLFLTVSLFYISRFSLSFFPYPVEIFSTRNARYKLIEAIVFYVLKLF